MDANYELLNGKIFIGGDKIPDASSHAHKYDQIPHGIVNRILKKRNMKHIDAERFRKISDKHWNIIKDIHSIGLPDERKYPEDTWEWTIGIEFFDHFVSSATHLLDISINQAKPQVLKSLIASCFGLELARIQDQRTNSSASSWKNLGLSYMHMVRNKETNGEFYLREVQHSFHQPLLFTNVDELAHVWWQGNEDWKSWASNRWASVWGHFLQMEGAKSDPAYEQVRSIYETVMKSKI